jgi:periplasmic divalent cation tolerance protein
MTENDALIAVHITTKDEAEARKLAGLLLEQKRAACVNIVPGVSTLYRWQGKIESGTESLMIVKTKRSLLHDIIALVKANHSYQVPEVLALPIDGGSPDYIAWLEDELAGPSAGGELPCAAE